MASVASFKQATSFETDKKINLVYGLNGTGKSTISNFLYEPNDTAFRQCKKTLAQQVPILVYNQKFIRDNFFVADNLKGIFSLSKENKAAEQKIATAIEEQAELEQSLLAKATSKEQITQEFSKQKLQAEDEVWNIKKTYSGGDRVLEYCLEGLKGQKDKLFAHLHSIPKPAEEPTRDVQTIRKKVQELAGQEAKPKQPLATLQFDAHEVEPNQLFGISIIGNADSEVAALIEQLGNSDWVKQGLAYLPEDLSDAAVECPFCQEATISQKFAENMKSYFDVSYQKQLTALGELLSKYKAAIEKLPVSDAYTDNPFAQERKSTILNKYQTLLDAMRENTRKIEEKIKNPKIPSSLSDTTKMAEVFNTEVIAINKDIDEFNDRLRNREVALKKLSEEFWLVMRWQYDQTMSRFEQDRQATEHKLQALDAEIQKITSDLKEVNQQIAEAQKQTVNVDAAIDAINAGLFDLGIGDFSIKKYSGNLYRVVRTNDSLDAFHSLSEGEKMIISFLYFCELCKGRTSTSDTHTQCIAVIDDPISSLSHLFIFNVGQIIRSVFFNGNRFCQVIVMTHSLYFFYELTDPNHERREKTQKLFRLSKPSSGSVIQEMKYEEIQNDYQAYWSVINNPDQPPALIANCMRNIVEYFFNFVRKKDLNNVFQMPELQNSRFQAFCRYINRESHSLGQNIIDLKEFDYAVFREGLRLVFEKTGYPDHYNAMCKC